MSHFDPSDPYWDPADDGDILTINGVEQGVPWEAMIAWAAGGWTRIVGINVGHATALLGLRTSMADPTTGRLRTGTVDLTPVPDGMTAVIASAVERYRADLELSQRVALVFRDVADWKLNRAAVPATLGGRAFQVLRKPSGDVDDVGIAAGLYQLFADLGRHSPTEDVATSMGLSRATAGRRIAQARERGILAPARPGTITRGTR